MMIVESEENNMIDRMDSLEESCGMQSNRVELWMDINRELASTLAFTRANQQAAEQLKIGSC